MTARELEEERALDHLALMIQSIGESKALLTKVDELRKASDDEHGALLDKLVAQMQRDGEDPAVVKVFKLFKDRNLFQVCTGALISCDYLKS